MTKKCECDEQSFNNCTCDYKPKFGKPGFKVRETKKTKISKKRTIEKPEKMNCVRCGRITETESHRHSESRIIKFLDGGGIMAGKIPDKLSAWLCDSCDAVLSKTPPKNSSEHVLNKHALDWFIAIAKTWLI